MISTWATEYQPKEIPSEITRELFVRYYVDGWQAGRIDISEHNITSPERILLCSVPITIKIPPQNDLTGKAVEVLEAEKQKILAESHQKIKAVQDKIDNLLAIEYKPEVVA